MNTSREVLWIRRLIWAYFFLIIFEGAVRKWILPGMAGPLLLVRLPIAVAIYALALRARIFPSRSAMTALILISLFSLFAGLAVLSNNPAIALFGFQATFLHLPLIFIIPKVLERQDIYRIGYITLILSMPLAAIMVLQFRSPAGAWINAGAGEGTQQITFALGHVRASATFSFVTGAVVFFSLNAAFIIWNMLARGQFRLWLVIGASLSTIVAAGVAGSRTLVVSLGVVAFWALFTVIFLQPHLVLRWFRIVCLFALIGIVVCQIPVFNESMHVFSVRAESASRAEGGTEGVFQSRVLDPIFGPFNDIGSIPILGYGLGMGTIGARALMSERVDILGEWETEWGRNISESGPILGVLFIVYRLWLVAVLLAASLRHARRGNSLPILLFSVCASSLLFGNFGQATTVGFAVFVGGLCYTAMRVLNDEQDIPEEADLASFNPAVEIPGTAH